MTPEEFLQKSKELVADYENAKLKHQIKGTVAGMVEDKKMWDRAVMTADDVYVVWWSKTLQNAKAVLSTDRRKGMYFECTLNGDKQVIYFDAYGKEHNSAIKLEEVNK